MASRSTTSRISVEGTVFKVDELIAYLERARTAGAINVVIDQSTSGPTDHRKTSTKLSYTVHHNG